MSEREKNEHFIEEPSLDRSVETALTDPHFAMGDWPEDKWWESFHSDELNELIREALECNPTIQSVKERIELARQRSLVARSRLFPFLFFDANESWQWLSKNGLYHTLNPSLAQNTNLVDLSLSFNYEFDFWGKYRNLYAAALGEVWSQTAEAKDVELIVSSALAQSYFALKVNLMRQKLLEELVTVRKKSYLLQALLQKKALLSKLPPSLAEERLRGAKKRYAGIIDEVLAQKHLINILRGEGPDSPFEVNDEVSSVAEKVAIPETLSLDLLSRRPDLMAAIWRVEALAHEVGAAKADFFPDINLRGLVGLESLGFSKLLQGDSITRGLFPAIHLPIFTAGAIRANVRAKKAAFNEAVYTYNQLLLQSSQEVADLLSLINSIFKKRDDQKVIVNAAAFRRDLVTLNFKKGLDDLLAVYAVEEEWIEKALEEAELIYAQYAASIKLIKALGGGYTCDFAD